MLIPDWDHPIISVELDGIYTILDIKKETTTVASNDEEKEKKEGEEEDKEDVEIEKFTPVSHLESTNTHVLIKIQKYFIVFPIAKKNGQILVYSTEATKIQFYDQSAIQSKQYKQQIVVWRGEIDKPNSSTGISEKLKTGFLVDIGLVELTLNLEEILHVMKEDQIEENSKFCFDIAIKSSNSKEEKLNVFEQFHQDTLRTEVYCVVFKVEDVANPGIQKNRINPMMDSDGNFRMGGIHHGKNLLQFDPEYFRLYKQYEFSEKVTLELQDVSPLDGNILGCHVTKQSLEEVNEQLKTYDLEVKELYSNKPDALFSLMIPLLPKNSIFCNNLLIYLTISPLTGTKPSLGLQVHSNCFVDILDSFQELKCTRKQFIPINVFLELEEVPSDKIIGADLLPIDDVVGDVSHVHFDENAYGFFLEIKQG